MNRYQEYCHACVVSTAKQMVCISAIGFGHEGYCDRCGKFDDLGSVRTRLEHAMAQMPDAQ